VTPEPPEQEPGGHLEPLPWGVLLGWGAAGLVLGWLLHRVVQATGGVVPVVGWVQATVLYFVAVVLLWVSRATRRSMTSAEHRPAPHRMVNRLVLARSCALAGALVAGAYVGLAIGWLGVSSELTGERLLRDGVAALGGVTMVVAALMLERACRVPTDDDSA